MKSGDTERVSVLRMIKAKILEAEVELRTKKGVDYQLNDPETIEVLSSYAKQRRQSIDSYRQGGREDLAQKEERELSIVQQYMPRQFSNEEITAVVREAIVETGAMGLKDLGEVMKLVMPRVQGAADGKVVNQIVRDQLSKG